MTAQETAIREQLSLISLMISETKRFNRAIPEASPIHKSNRDRIESLQQEESDLRSQLALHSDPIALHSKRVVEMAGFIKVDSKTEVEAIARKFGRNKLDQAILGEIQQSQEIAAEHLARVAALWGEYQEVA